MVICWVVIVLCVSACIPDWHTPHHTHQIGAKTGAPASGPAIAPPAMAPTKEGGGLSGQTLDQFQVVQMLSIHLTAHTSHHIGAKEEGSRDKRGDDHTAKEGADSG